jgi:hypothetical protein
VEEVQDIGHDKVPKPPVAAQLLLLLLLLLLPAVMPLLTWHRHSSCIAYFS